MDSRKFGARSQLQEQTQEEWNHDQEEYKRRQAQEISQNLDMLAEMQGDINAMINQQADGINNIDDSINKSDELLVQGLQEVAKAEKIAAGKHKSRGLGVTAVIGGAVGILGGPIGVAAGAVIGGVVGRGVGGLFTRRAKRAVDKELEDFEKRRDETLNTAKKQNLIKRSEEKRAEVESSFGKQKFRRDSNDWAREEYPFEGGGQADETGRPNKSSTSGASGSVEGGKMKGPSRRKGRSRHYSGKEADCSESVWDSDSRQNRSELFARSDGQPANSSSSSYGGGGAASTRQGSHRSKEQDVYGSVLHKAQNVQDKVHEGNTDLSMQSEVIRPMSARMDLQDDIIETSKRVTNASSIWGTIKNAFTSKPKVTKYPERKSSDKPSTRSVASDWEEDGVRFKQLTLEDKANGDVLDKVSNVLYETKQMSVLQGQELAEQNRILNEVSDKTDNVTEKTKKQTWRIQRRMA